MAWNLTVLFHDLGDHVLDQKNTTGGGMRTDIKHYSEYQASIIIWTYLSPIVLVVGTIGSILSLLVLCRKSLRTQTTMFYLSVLAVADLMVLYGGLIRLWLEHAQNFYIRLTSGAACKFHTFLVYLSLDLSVWVLVAVSIDRCLYVTWPLSAKKWCTLRNAWIIVGAIVLFSVLINIHFLWTYDLELYDSQQIYANGNKKCYADTSSELTVSFVENVWPWIDFCVYCLFPFISMATSNAIIIKQLIRTEKTLASYQSSVTDRTQGSGSRRGQEQYVKSTDVRVLFASSTQRSNRRPSQASGRQDKQRKPSNATVNSDSLEFAVGASSLHLAPGSVWSVAEFNHLQKPTRDVVYANKGFMSEVQNVHVSTDCPDHVTSNVTSNVANNVTINTNTNFDVLKRSSVMLPTKSEHSNMASLGTNLMKTSEQFQRQHKPQTILTDVEMHEPPGSPMSGCTCEECSLLRDKPRFGYEREGAGNAGKDAPNTSMKPALELLDEVSDIMNSTNALASFQFEEHCDKNSLVKSELQFQNEGRPLQKTAERRKATANKIHPVVYSCCEQVAGLAESSQETQGILGPMETRVNILKTSNSEKDLLVRKMGYENKYIRRASHEISITETAIDKDDSSLRNSYRVRVQGSTLPQRIQKDTTVGMNPNERFGPIISIDTKDSLENSTHFLTRGVAGKSLYTLRSIWRSNSEASETQITASSRRSTSSVSKTLLAVTLMFWILNAPIVIFVIGHTYFVESANGQGQATIILVWTIVNILQYMNNALHFFLYCLTGPKFRQELKGTFKDGIQIMKRWKTQNP